MDRAVANVPQVPRGRGEAKLIFRVAEDGRIRFADPGFFGDDAAFTGNPVCKTQRSVFD